MAWSFRDFILLISSIIVNYAFGFLLKKSLQPYYRKITFISSILCNLIYLFYFKYDFPQTSIIMPLAISFYTFEQIVFQYEVYSQKVTRIKLLDYLVFISFFPRLIAGPIYYFSEYKEKFRVAIKEPINYEKICLGFGIFTFGLCKKVIIADKLARYADAFYHNDHLYNHIDGWFCTLAYTFQIYFDFSGYSDMAIGLGLMIGILLPINFNSPYQATSIIDFWSRWHISLSKLIRDYIYIPLGGNKRGTLRKLFNILLTMTICGMWHGSTINFIIWGFLHGVFININHLCKKIKINPIIGQGISFFVVHLLWIPFRAIDLNQTKRVIDKLFTGYNGLVFSFEKVDLLFLFFIGFICFCLPNTLAFFLSNERKFYSFRPNHAWMIILLLTSIISFTGIGDVSPFLYFNF